MTLECKSRKSRDTWSNRQVWPWGIKWSRAKSNRILSRKHAGHDKHPFAMTQEMTLHMDITRWSILKSDCLCSLQPKMEKLYTVSKTKSGSKHGSDHELLIAKFSPKLKKVGKTIKPFMYDLNQIPYDYIVEVTSRLKGSGLIVTLYRRQWWKEK